MSRNELKQLKEYVLNNIIVSIIVGGVIATGITTALMKYGYLEFVAVVAFIGIIIVVMIRFITIRNTIHLLIVEDSNELSSDLKEFFSRQRITIKIVNSIESAKAAIEHEQFHFALIDLVLFEDTPECIENSVQYFLELRNSDIKPFVLSGKSFEETEAIFKKVLQSEIDKNVSWETLRHDIVSCYFYKKDIQDLMRLVREIKRSN